MIQYLFLLSLLCSVGAAITAYEGIPIAPGILALIAYFLGYNGVKQTTRHVDIVGWALSVIAMAYAMDPAHFGLPWFMIMAAALILVSVPRSLFFQSMGYMKFGWLEPGFALIALAFYIIANVFTPVGWQGWAFPALMIFFALFQGVGTAQSCMQMKAVKDQKYKAEIGSSAPDFCLPNHEGEEIKLSDYRDKNCVLLVFVRGDWCPSCHIMLRSYERNKNKFREKNVTVMAIGPDPVGVNRDMVKRLDVSYHILADEKRLCANLYGIRLQDNNPMTKYAEGIPLPASFLVDQGGYVRFTSRADNPDEILNPEDIFPVLEKIA